MKRAISLIEDHDKAKLSKKEEIPNKIERINEPAFDLSTQYERVLYFKYSGLYKYILEKVQTEDSVSKVIAQLTGDKAKSIRQLLLKIPQGYTDKTKDENIFKRKYVENTINALKDSGFDTVELSKVYDKIIKKESL